MYKQNLMKYKKAKINNSKQEIILVLLKEYSPFLQNGSITF